MLNCTKNQFQLPTDEHYLNCAYMSPLSASVEAAGIAAVLKRRVPSAIHPEDFIQSCDGVRSKFAKLIGASDPSRIAALAAVSYGIATIARNVSFTRGQNIVLLHEQFPSNVYSWRRIATEQNVELRFASSDVESDEPRAVSRNRQLLDYIDENTAIVSVPIVHWADGSLVDLKSIRKRCDDVDALFVIDGTQSIGALTFDVQEIRPDALICAGYKWLFGPYSTALGYFGPRFDNGIPLEENWLNRAGSEQFGGLVEYRDEYQPGSLRYDVGGRSNFTLMPMLDAALEHVLDWTPAAIQEYCHDLTEELTSIASSFGYRIEDREYRASHLFGIRTPDSVSVDDLRHALDAANVVASVRGDAVRISPHLYNDASDIDALAKALESAVRVTQFSTT